MTDIKEFADQLQQEVVTDMAENYFGTRKNLEDMTEGFQNMVEELRRLVPRLSRAASSLHYLLLDRHTARDFYIALDIVPSCIPFGEDGTDAPDLYSIPFAFTARGRYEKCVLAAYHGFQRVADEYLNGKYYQDPEHPKRKRLTVHYLRMRALCEHINEEVDRVNKGMSASATLRYVKSMDPVRMEREQAIGQVCMNEGCSLDGEMKFSPLDFDSLGLPVVQDLPALYKVRTNIVHFCRDLYAERENDIKAMLSSLKKTE